MTPRFWLLQFCAFALLFWAWYSGLVLDFFMRDRTYLTLLIAAATVGGVICAGLRRWQVVEYLRDNLPTFGLLGTVIGFSIAVSGITGDDFDIKMLGLATALNTTISGLIGSLWLGLCGRLLR